MDTSHLSHFFGQLEIFTPSEIAEVIQHFHYRKIPRSSYFAREGEQCREVAFINSGVFRSYYTNRKGEQVTYCFRFAQDLMASYSSFITGRPSMESLQAITPGELLVIQKETIDKLSQHSPNWVMFMKTIAEQQYLEMEDRIFQLQRDDAQERYIRLVENQPDYILQIPLQYLASYLGITPRHLSRIRRQQVIQQVSD